MKTKNAKKFLSAFSVTLIICALLQNSANLRSDVNINSGIGNLSAINSNLIRRNQCSNCGLQMIFLPVNMDRQTIAFQYNFDAAVFSTHSPSTIVEKLQIFSAKGQSLLLNVRNVHLHAGQKTAHSQIFRIPVTPGNYSVNLQLFDIATERTLQHHCSFMIRDDFGFEFENSRAKIRQDLLRV